MDDHEIRSECIEAASRVWAGRGAGPDVVLAAAHQFFLWLTEKNGADEDEDEEWC